MKTSPRASSTAGQRLPRNCSRHRADRAHVDGDILATHAVAARGGLHQPALFVAQRDGEPVELRLGRIHDALDVEPFARAAVEIDDVLLGEGVVEREHRHGVHDLAELAGSHARRRAASASRGRRVRDARPRATAVRASARRTRRPRPPGRRGRSTGNCGGRSARAVRAPVLRLARRHAWAQAVPAAALEFERFLAQLADAQRRERRAAFVGQRAAEVRCQCARRKDHFVEGIGGRDRARAAPRRARHPDTASRHCLESKVPGSCRLATLKRAAVVVQAVENIVAPELRPSACSACFSRAPSKRAGASALTRMARSSAAAVFRLPARARHLRFSDSGRLGSGACSRARGGSCAFLPPGRVPRPPARIVFAATWARAGTRGVEFGRGPGRQARSMRRNSARRPPALRFRRRAPLERVGRPVKTAGCEPLDRRRRPRLTGAHAPQVQADDQNHAGDEQDPGEVRSSSREVTLRPCARLRRRRPRRGASSRARSW